MALSSCRRHYGKSEFESCWSGWFHDQIFNIWWTLKSRMGILNAETKFREPSTAKQRKSYPLNTFKSHGGSANSYHWGHQPLSGHAPGDRGKLPRTRPYPAVHSNHCRICRKTDVADLPGGALLCPGLLDPFHERYTRTHGNMHGEPEIISSCFTYWTARWRESPESSNRMPCSPRS